MMMIAKINYERVLLWISAIGLVVLVEKVSAFSAAPANDVNSRFAEIPPLKAAMLTKTWQGLMLDVEEKVGVVPELGATSVSIRRSGSEMPRRKLCKKQFISFYESTFAMALADKLPKPVAMKNRKAITSLVMDGKLVGPQCVTYASLTQPATLALVVQTESEWSILALTVNPTERKIEPIIAAEYAMLDKLRECAKENGASIRINSEATSTMAGSNEQLCLAPPDTDDEGAWFQCQEGPASPN